MTSFACKAALAAPFLISSAGLTAADPAGGSDGYSHHMWGGGFGIFGGGLMLISWIAILVLIVFAIKWLIDRDGPKNRQSSALDTLNMRFAKGEIDAAEYETRRKILEN